MGSSKLIHIKTAIFSRNVLRIHATLLLKNLALIWSIA